MTETVGCGGLSLGNEGAVSVVDALGNSYQAVALLSVNLLHVSHELVHVEVGLGEVDEVGTSALSGSQTSSSGQPASVTAHDLNNTNHAGVVNASVLIDLHAGSSDVLGSGSVARAVVGAEQVVVDGLRDAHNAAVVTGLHHELGDLVAGIHGVVTAVVEEVTNVILLEDLEDTLVIGIVNVGISQLVTAGTESRRRGVAEKLELFAVFLVDVEQLVVEHTADAVSSTQNAGDRGAVESGLDCAENRRVDDGSGATGLADDASAL